MVTTSFKKGFRIWGNILFWIGAFLVVVTHLGLGFQAITGNLELVGRMFSIHIIINLVAVFLIILGWMLRREADII